VHNLHNAVGGSFPKIGGKEWSMTRVARLGAYLLTLEAELWADPSYKFEPKNKPGDQIQLKASTSTEQNGDPTGTKDQQIAYWKEKYEEMVSLAIFVHLIYYSFQKRRALLAEEKNIKLVEMRRY
jgi:hypothetical protein